MTHLEWHQHAFLDENNVVITIAVFEEWAHNHQLLEDVKKSVNASKVICCCQYGLTSIGMTWDDQTNSWSWPYDIPPLAEVSPDF